MRDFGGNVASTSGATLSKDEETEVEEGINKASTKTIAKSTKRTATKVAAKAEPKKVAAGVSKAKGKATKPIKQDVKQETKACKSPSFVTKSPSSAPQCSKISTAGNPANDYTDEEIYEANYRGISVEDWRAWTAEADWEPQYAPTPRAHISDEN